MSCSIASRGEPLPLLSAYVHTRCHTSSLRRVEPLAGGVNVMDLTVSLLRVVSANGVGYLGLVENHECACVAELVGHEVSATARDDESLSVW